MRPILLNAFLGLIASTTLAAPAFGETDASGPIAAVMQPYVDRHTLAGAVTLVADNWPEEGKKILPAFEKAAVDQFASKASEPSPSPR